MRVWLVGVAAALVALAPGCSPQGENPTTLVQVRGKAVGPDGKPAQGLELAFYPTERGGTTAYAKLAKDGTFAPKSLGNQDGIPPGRYRVVVSTLGGKAAAGVTPTRVSPKLTSDTASDLIVEVQSGTTELTVALK